MRQTNINEYQSLKIDENKKTIEHYISTEAVNRYGYVLKNAGMQKENYLKNPIVLYQHNAGGFFTTPKPSEVIIGKNLSLTNDSKGIVAITQFDNSELATDIFDMNAAGLMNAWSVGWDSAEAPVMVNGVETVYNWELLEYSAVIIPGNPEAVNKALSFAKSDILKKSLSIDLAISEINFEANKKYSELETKFNQLNTDVTKKDLIDFKNEMKSLINNHKKQTNNLLMEFKLNTLNIETNLHSKMLSKIENTVNGMFNKFLGKL